MEMIVVLGIFFIFITFVFIGIAIFFPEWLGITGSKAKEVIRSHEGDKSDETDLKS